MKKSTRYSRQETLGIIGKSGQKKIETAKVTIVGTGALGTVAAELLVRAGVLNLTLVDRDFIEESNLQRQFLYDENDIGKLKAETLKNKLVKINSKVKLKAINVHLNSKNIKSTIKKPEILLDCTDNMKTRLLINDYCKKNKIEWIYAAAVRYSGNVSLISPKGPCLNCFLPNNALGGTCMEKGVLNTTTTIIAGIQVNLTLKKITKNKVNSNQLIRYNGLNNEITILKFEKRKNCKVCNGQYEYLNEKIKKTTQFCSSNKFQILGKKHNFEKLKIMLKKANIDYNSDNITLQFGPIILFLDGRAIVNAKSIDEAESLYSKYIGN
jgi:molybdopterin-synthase adenylyltransferase